MKNTNNKSDHNCEKKAKSINQKKQKTNILGVQILSWILACFLYQKNLFPGIIARMRRLDKVTSGQIKWS